MRRGYDFLVRGIGGAKNQFVDFMVGNGFASRMPSLLERLDEEHVFELAPAMLTS